MLILKAEQWFDLNKLGLVVTFLIAVLVLFYPFNLWVIMLLELSMLAHGYYLYSKIRQLKSGVIMINSDNKWFVRIGKEMHPVDLKDYWLQTERLFIWLQGSKKSISFVITRSIIGAQKFSQLRARI